MRTSKRKAWRSGFEEKTAAALEKSGVPYSYEGMKLTYIVPAATHTYTPDFYLPTSGIFVETKGLWDAADRQKIVRVIQEHPEIDLRMLFQNPNTKIYKGSPTSYAKFCDKRGIRWAKGPAVPVEWTLPKDSQ